MPRKAREMSPREVGRLIKPGRWSVGGVDGLALQVTATGARSSGLGLPFVSEVARLHGGNASVEAGASGGTRALLWLPR